MRGSDAASGALFSYVDMEARVPVALKCWTRSIPRQVQRASYRRILVTEGVRRQRLELAI